MILYLLLPLILGNGLYCRPAEFESEYAFETAFEFEFQYVNQFEFEFDIVNLLYAEI